MNIKISNAASELTTEQMAPYISRVLKNSVNWSVTTQALLMKCWGEASRGRTVERACLQIQALISQFAFKEGDSLLEERIEYLLSDVAD